MCHVTISCLLSLLLQLKRTSRRRTASRSRSRRLPVVSGGLAAAGDDGELRIRWPVYILSLSSLNLGRVGVAVPMLRYTYGLFCYLCFFSGYVAACIASSGKDSGKIRINLPMFVSSIGDLLCPCLSSVATTSASTSSPLGTSDEDPAFAVKKGYVILPICGIGLIVRRTFWWFTSPSGFLLSGEPGSSLWR